MITMTSNLGRLGLLNASTGDLSELAGAKETVSVGKCDPCGFVTTDTKLDQCPKCDYFLEWKKVKKDHHYYDIFKNADRKKKSSNA